MSSAGWQMDHDENGVHVHPLRDLFEHDLVTTECLCGPKVEFVDPEDGLTYANGPFVSHYSLDGREDAEDDAL